MKVKDILKKLENVSPETSVVCYTEDEKLLASGRSVFEINAIDVIEVEKYRNNDGVPGLKFEKTDCSPKHVILEITSDF